jgi:exopolysaccharide biosynthesis polyprenyl glycosylphosphotransferase
MDPCSSRLGVRLPFGTSSWLWRPASPVAVRAWLDFVTALAAGTIAIYLCSKMSAVPIIDAVGVPRQTLSVSLIYLMLFGGFLMLCSQLYGLYAQDLNQGGLHEQRMTVQATVTAALLVCGTLYFLPGYLVSRTAVMLTAFLVMIMLMLRRAIWRQVIERRHLQGMETRNVLIIGRGQVAQALRTHLETLRHMGFRFKGFISVYPNDNSVGYSDVVAHVDNCVAVARSLFIDEIYCATSLDRCTLISVAQQAHSMGINVHMVPDLYDGIAWNARVEYIGPFPTIPLVNREFPHGPFLVKRLMDVVLAFVALLVLWPLPALIALVIWSDSPGPILYRSERIGRKGCKFTCLKFRTMVRDADQRREELAHLNERKGVLFKMTNDPRITRVGAFLRKYSLDEIPQLLNVLRGEMSLVGPRPPTPSEVEQYELAHLRRLDVMPGITGLWQVEARQDPSFDSYISLDTAYVENWHLLLDLRILARTVRVVLSGTGA